ncbi:uncharacterized protein SPAPADRAFT_67124 [Spathaspora passalidarum NRRL Y-27907]|uniref:Flo11 domain-containing protein n=1 Tax=Spathaspora passalidarum (strain NRRL Y-27907 / 11-Y1) TaxID=619300 RepID=G3ANI9_SPAPN|nr:uncharacterized protein SPAPADRAFT_67124 [Spathaspora passalidarum NRRL Y-27907]EGW32518.1 hypothetical protein SPAPADRAFT_67124 [Spathaspora passalidarum NRRL Y-27907]
MLQTLFLWYLLLQMLVPANAATTTLSGPVTVSRPYTNLPKPTANYPTSWNGNSICSSSLGALSKQNNEPKLKIFEFKSIKWIEDNFYEVMIEFEIDSKAYTESELRAIYIFSLQTPNDYLGSVELFATSWQQNLLGNSPFHFYFSWVMEAENINQLTCTTPFQVYYDWDTYYATYQHGCFSDQLTDLPAQCWNAKNFVQGVSQSDTKTSSESKTTPTKETSKVGTNTNVGASSESKYKSTTEQESKSTTKPGNQSIIETKVQINTQQPVGTSSEHSHVSTSMQNPSTSDSKAPSSTKNEIQTTSKPELGISHDLEEETISLSAISIETEIIEQEISTPDSTISDTEEKDTPTVDGTATPVNDESTIEPNFEIITTVTRTTTTYVTATVCSSDCQPSSNDSVASDVNIITSDEGAYPTLVESVYTSITSNNASKTMADYIPIPGNSTNTLNANSVEMFEGSASAISTNCLLVVLYLFSNFIFV